MDRRWDQQTASRGRARLKSRIKAKGSRYGLGEVLYQRDREFRCAHCAHVVITDPVLSGVQNRNHCPYCLWSRHLDLHQAGDRLSACKAPMKPVGLTLKQVHKKYERQNAGELMLIHQCAECGKTSINRVAADDIPETLFEVFESSFQLEPQIRVEFETAGIQALEAGDASIVWARLFGVGSMIK